MKHLVIVFSASILLLAGCNGSDDSAKNNSTDSTATSGSGNETKEERNKQTAMASIQSFIDRNVDDVLKNADPNTVEYGDGSSPPVRNLDSMKLGMRAWMDAFPDYKGENLLAIADGDHVAVYGDWSGTFKKDFMGMKATGKSFKAKDVDIFTFNDAGKITEHRNVQSMGSIWQQLGVPMKK